jgi:LmbE family N-acetylglucosaminyl deacetylase
MPREVAVFSSHLDDGVFSASAQLMRPQAQLITVFAGPPPDVVMVGNWDRLTRASTSWERHRERLLEDERACSILNCQPTHLNEPECEYRHGDLDLAELSQRMMPFMADVAEVWLPAGIGGHPDHRAVRRSGLAALAEAAASPACYLYADIPYSIYYGWPAWVSGGACPDYLDLDYQLRQDLRAEDLDPDALKPIVVTLDADQQALKLRAASCYHTQLAALGIGLEDKHRWSFMLSYEVGWRIEIPKNG